MEEKWMINMIDNWDDKKINTRKKKIKNWMSVENSVKNHNSWQKHAALIPLTSSINHVNCRVQECSRTHSTHTVFFFDFVKKNIFSGIEKEKEQHSKR